jgi:SAM-dependent methyltransferase
MLDSYPNTAGSERTIETKFVLEMVQKYHRKSNSILDVGGVPTKSQEMEAFYNFISSNQVNYNICDFRGGKYVGDFVSLPFNETFDIVMFLSSLEHFPQCTESDVVFRQGYDRKGYEKALSVLNPKGHIILTVPFGKHRWQPFHQNYNMKGILDLTQGSSIVEMYTYKLAGEVPNGPRNGTWNIETPQNMEEVLYEDRAFGVGCFVLQKD